MSFQALSSAISGLRVAQQQLNVISNNIANVGTEGYTRKILPQATQVINGTGEVIGVRGQLIIRNVDLNLSRDLWTQESAVSALNVKQIYLSKIDAFNGPPDSEVSIAAQLSNLKDDLAALVDNPNDTFLQKSVVTSAEIVADKFNDFGDFITQSRNDVQDELEVVVDRVNGLLNQIADLNTQIRGSANVGRSSADLEDLRDLSIKQLSQELDITFFQRGDGVLVIQTSTGVQLADENASEVYFDPNVLGPTIVYPGGAAGLYVGGNPLTNPASVDVTQTDLGGRVGSLLELRDETLITYQAQLDELAHKTALRFDAQGLRLFTDENGDIPLDTPPDLGTDPITPVEYVGFASNIQVNRLIIADNSLLQRGTYVSDITIPTGSSEILSRVLEYTFGDVSYQEAVGSVDITIASSGSADLQEHLGVYSQNQIVLGPNLTSFPQIDSLSTNPLDLITTLSEFLPNYPADDEFRIQLYDRSGAAIPTTINVDLSTLGTDPLYAIGSVDPSGTLTDGTIDNALDQLVAFINTTIINEEIALNIPTDIAARATINTNGQLVFNSRSDVEFQASGFANAISDEAFTALFGGDADFYEAEDPYLDIQIGSLEPVRITIAPGEDETDLLAKLQKLSIADAGVAGLYVDDAAFALGTLSLRPGQDETGLNGPFYGGSLKIIAGTGSADGTGVAAAGASIVEALFGTSSPVSSVEYGSETSQLLGVGSGVFVPFRSANLGQSGLVNAEIVSGDSLIDYAQKMVTSQAQDLSIAKAELADEETLQELLSTRLLNESAVNIDEELSQLILVQTAYSAAARAITAVDELFRELLEAVR